MRSTFRSPVPAPINEELSIPVRFVATELIAPAGSHLRPTVSGMRQVKPDALVNYTMMSTPSGADTTVTILHDCEHQSALRFLVPADPLLVGPGQSVEGVKPSKDGEFDGGGIASKKVCHDKPLHPADVSRL